MYRITGLLGIGFAVAPFAFGYADNSVALWTSLLLGGAVMITSYLEAAANGKDQWEYTISMVVGAGAIIAPFVLGFRELTVAMWTSVGVGILLALVGGYKLFSNQSQYG